jgi:ABC-type glycerol-3-phosphate transport system substrate-binding protein
MRFCPRRVVSLVLSLILVVASISYVYGASDVPLREKFDYGGGGLEPSEYYDVKKYPYYMNVLQEYEENGYVPAIGSAIIIEPKDAVASDESLFVLKSNIGGRTTPAFVWNDDLEWTEWRFDIENEGLYEVEIEYYLLLGSGVPAVRSLSVDSKIPFLEANNIVFYRSYKDESEPKTNSIGDEVRPGQIEVPGWKTVKLEDGQGLYCQPFQFYFKPGSHTIRLEYVDQPIAIGDVYIKPADIIPAYEQVLEEYRQKGYKNATETYEFQAENTVIEKSDPTLRRENDNDPTCKPVSFTSRKLNVIGGVAWRKGNQSITWEFTVPESGLYKLGIRELQVWNDGLPTSRQILIDGKIPFKELEEYKFNYNTRWNTEVLKDSSGNPYLFYLEEGTHTITMKVKLGSLTEIIYSISEDALLLSDIIRSITKITGSNPDPNYDYQFMKTIPDLEDNMQTLVDSLQYKYDLIKGMSDKLPAMANNFLSIKSQLESMIRNPFSIAARLQELNNAQNSLGTWYQDLQSQPLLIDYFMLGDPEATWKNERSTFFQRLKATIMNFIISFKKDYDNIGSTIVDESQVKEVINVWVARGTEWAELLKEMADEEFTPESGIAINMNVLPASQLNAGAVNVLMLSINSGKAPDVAMGVEPGSPVEFAIRDAVYDLSEFPSYEEVEKRFLPNIFIPFRYRGGVYALPETMNFTVMFYRKDILSELGLNLPETREDLYNYTLPKLYQNNMQFHFPADYSQFIFQKGADFYTPDGLRTGLDTPEAYQAFKECSELYTNYAVPVVANFYNRFRTGEMPIGIGGYIDYLMFSVAAPELAGRWGIAPLPGTRRPDGTIDRTAGGLAGQADIILKQSEKPDESWEFLKWWTSTQVQTRYARELEALIGAEARWCTANYEAFTSLAWNRSDLKVIEEQLGFQKDIPVVLGGYFTSRHLNNAWNRVVINGQPIRDALEQAVEDINRELRMKQEEYGVMVD